MDLIRASVPRQEFIEIIEASILDTNLCSADAERLRKAARTMTSAARGSMTLQVDGVRVMCPLNHAGLYRPMTAFESDWTVDGGGQFIGHFDTITGRVFIDGRRPDVLDIIDD